MILVDTNVLLDIVEDDPNWRGWSQRQLEAAHLRDRLCINPVIYAELSIAFRRIEELDSVLSDGDIDVLESLPREALFLAGKAFVEYRKRGGASKKGVLPDFFIGAHAAVGGMTLLTRDVARIRSYFPTVRMISPS
ncbi:MAG: type II toxin-antitoxin system VapC family toxin [Gammaproteobacteria bacterium]|nr:type II toxin-antitoxin system VapC family toxin [Gammaproteobacteria bacterium]